MLSETRSEGFVYFRCPACKDLLAIPKPRPPIELAASTDFQPESDPPDRPAADGQNSTVNDAERPARDKELWRLRKGDRELRCVASQQILHLVEGEMVRRAEILPERLQMEERSLLWQRMLMTRGWK
jgi:hypothetical protein